jgi:hypothetical protein
VNEIILRPSGSFFYRIGIALETITEQMRDSAGQAPRPTAANSSPRIGRNRKSRHKASMTPSEKIDQLIAGIADWRGQTFAAVRKAVLAADAAIVEEWKWMGSPVWSRDGMIAVADAHKGKVKLTFAHGASLADPDKLFNAGLEGNMRRAIDFLEGDKVNERALKALVRAAIEFNQAKKKKKAPAGAKAKVRKSKKV